MRRAGVVSVFQSDADRKRSVETKRGTRRARAVEVFKNHILSRCQIYLVIISERDGNLLLRTLGIIVWIIDHVREPEGVVHLADLCAEPVSGLPFAISQVHEDKFPAR